MTRGGPQTQGPGPTPPENVRQDDAGPTPSSLPENEPAQKFNRRAALAIGAALFALGGLGLQYRASRALSYEPMDDLPGFRRLARSQSITSFNAATIGLGSSRPRLPPVALETARAVVASDIYTALHGPEAGDVPVSFFTSAGCPLCGPQAERLRGLIPDITLRPLAFFGPASDRAARAMIAAPDPWALHDRLIGTAIVTDDPFIRAVADRSPTIPDPDTLFAAMDSPDTDARLALNHALASRLGIPGTPAIVIGRTIVVGMTARRDLARILDDETARP
ncbi:MAG: DsbA family protein [Pseudomonadota bacterium]